MLDDTGREELFEYLLPVAQNAGEPTLIDAMPQILRRHFTPGKPFAVMLRSAIRICEEDGFSRNPSSLSQFVAQLAPLSEKAHILAPIAAALRAPPPGMPDPYDALVIRQFVPFIDRKPLRLAMRRLVADHDIPLLLVNGPRWSGKSFTSHFIDHLATRHDQLEHCIVKAADDTDPPGVLEIARDMMAKLGGKPSALPPPDATNQKRWPRELANEVTAELLERTDAAPRTWIIVLDVGGRQPLSLPVATFIHQLATNLTTGAGRRHHRLILIDIPIDALPDLELYSQEIAIQGLSTAEVHDDLDRLFRNLGRPDSSDLAQGILNGLSEPHEDMREIGRRSAGVIRKLVELTA
ncbi:hypothetical protein [Sphingomonas sp. PAMC 26621]|uniref:hypothetical protein n=1 Tax=Sphingomonas sp. PAMC 26621 TaxID=1112213 RepID=UPI0002896C97|nr:hypothetical protein [Sphingomonas sp. PAMC 26621]